jgi:hypothetical protein
MDIFKVKVIFSFVLFHNRCPCLQKITGIFISWRRGTVMLRCFMDGGRGWGDVRDIWTFAKEICRGK